MTTERKAVKVVVQNRKARHDYELQEVMEAGMVLNGPEVKSLRAGKGSLIDAYARVEGGELYLHNAHITPYSYCRPEVQDPLRVRKLLVHKQEVRRLTGKVKEKGLSLIPLAIYFKAGRAKVEIAVARGKKLYDKREDLKRRDQEMEIRKAMKRDL
ncbi:MAG: SsrA-binding protein SmpB [Pseudomonadota bacterium]